MAALIQDLPGSVPSRVATPACGWSRADVEAVMNGPCRLVSFSTRAGLYWMAVLNLAEGADGPGMNALATLISGTLVMGPALVVPPWEARRVRTVE